MTRIDVDLDTMTWDELLQLGNLVRSKMLKADSRRNRQWQEEALNENPDLLEAFGGATILSFCEDLVFHAKRLKRPVTGEFNQARIEATPDSDPGALLRAWCEGPRRGEP